MSEPRWLREKRRYLQECERYPRRWVMPIQPPSEDVWTLSHGRIFTIPVEETVEEIPKRQRPRIAGWRQ